MSNNQQQRKTVLDEWKLALNTKPLAQGAKPPALRINVYRNNPGLVCFTGHDNGSGVTIIRAGMDVEAFFALIQFIRYFASENTEPGKIKIENKKSIPKNERTDPKVKLKVSSEVWVGKDEDGKVWISVLSAENQQAPKIRFYFGLGYYHAVKAKEGDGFVSRMVALGWADILTGLVLNVMNDNGFTGQQSENSNKNNGGGGYNKSNNNYSNKSTSGGGGGVDDGFDDSFDDDFD